ASLITQANPASPPPTTMTRLLFNATAITSPHFLTHCRAFRVDELQMMVQVFVGRGDQIEQRLSAGFRMVARARERVVRQLRQDSSELPAADLHQRHRVL